MTAALICVNSNNAVQGTTTTDGLKLIFISANTPSGLSDVNGIRQLSQTISSAQLLNHLEIVVETGSQTMVSIPTTFDRPLGRLQLGETEHAVLGYLYRQE